MRRFDESLNQEEIGGLAALTLLNGAALRVTASFDGASSLPIGVIVQPFVFQQRPADAGVSYELFFLFLE